MLCNLSKQWLNLFKTGGCPIILLLRGQLSLVAAGAKTGLNTSIKESGIKTS
jgi:hypothetical protein